MATRGTPRKHLSVRIPAHLEEFLREKGSEHVGGFSGIVEDALILGAVAHGYEPPASSPAYLSFAETVAGLVADRMEEKGLVAQPKADD